MAVSLGSSPTTDGTSLPGPKRFSHYRSILGKVAHLVVVVNNVGTIIDVEPAISTYLGWTPSETVGRSAFDFIHHGDHQNLAVELLRELNDPTRPAPSIVVRALHADGRVIELEILGKAALEDPLVAGIVVSLRLVSGVSLGQRALAAGDYLYEALSTTASDGTTIFDAKGNRVFTSSSLCSMLGYSRSELSSIGPSELMFEEDLEKWKATTRRAIAKSKGVDRVECRVVRKDGHPLWIEATVVNLLGESGIDGVVVHVRDIDERHSFQQELIRQASIDDLTGLANRSALRNRLDQMSAAGQRRTVMFCDLDGFKAVNDLLGHGVGDQLIADIGRRFRSDFRICTDGGLIGRMGGDEFCIVIDAVSDDSAGDIAGLVIELIREVADNVICTHNNLVLASGLKVGVSIGIASDQAIADGTADTLLSRADHAMYQSKKRGRNQITYG
jgi:diguanylate cyclase (GGDEF)-like protein/PAS domain S-box-containing protein